MTSPPIKISVLRLVAITCASGDLSSGLFSPPDRTARTIRAHQKIQKSYGQEYEPEVTVTLAVEEDQIAGNLTSPALVLQISGRIDGVIRSATPPVVEEIKTVLSDLDTIQESDHPIYWAQARCYAYMFALQNDLPEIILRMTYVQLDTQETKQFDKFESIDELSVFFTQAVNRYFRIARMAQEWKTKRDLSITALSFPFGEFRPGQRDFAAAVYRAIKNRKQVFAQAPTGTGKTIATLFPAIKALGENAAEKIFYLTAKGLTASLAENALDMMRKTGLRLRSVTLTAKDKICFLPDSPCEPTECLYCKGYYDRLGAALMDTFGKESLRRAEIEDAARTHSVCPFELSLDIALWCDSILCDYNYVFDPNVYLRRFFEEEDGNYVFLIDEAHNLVDRSQEMFSAQCIAHRYISLKKKIRSGMPETSRALSKVIKLLGETEAAMGEHQFTTDQDPNPALILQLTAFLRVAQKRLARNEPHPARDELLDIYFETYSFLRIEENYDEHYCTTLSRDDKSLILKLFCIDPSFLLRQALRRCSAAVFFSATLSPLDYFRDILGGDADAKLIRIGSPFPAENLNVLVNSTISTLYRNRTNTAHEISRLISEMVRLRTGNYLVFFPSYQYLKQVLEYFYTDSPDIRSLIQKQEMNECDRKTFLESFSADNKETLVGFAVMGGVFGEGIDLVGDKLIGAVVVGVGLPQVCPERELIKNYFQNKRNAGFDFAYTFPGMNKVLQAAGRVIRTEKDKGVVLLIDQRFNRHPYKYLLPPEWVTKHVDGKESIAAVLDNFWM